MTLFAAGLLYAATVLHVVDGDTFDVKMVIWPHSPLLEATQRIRVYGADTPEKSGKGVPPCEKVLARKAQDLTEQLILDAATVTVELVDEKDSFGRMLGIVRLDGVDLAEILLSHGLARPYSRKAQEWCHEEGVHPPRI